MEDIDLLASHDLGESNTAYPDRHHKNSDLKILIWHKIDSKGYQPATREVILTNIVTTHILSSYYFLK
jgi:hypothetical protein